MQPTQSRTSRLVVPAPTNAETVARIALSELMNHHIPQTLGATDLVACFVCGQNRLLTHLLQLNPGLRIVTPSGDDITETYTKTANSGA